MKKEELLAAVKCGGLNAVKADDALKGVVYSEIGGGEEEDGYLLTFCDGSSLEYSYNMVKENALEALNNLEDNSLKEFWQAGIFAED